MLKTSGLENAHHLIVVSSVAEKKEGKKEAKLKITIHQAPNLVI